MRGLRLGRQVLVHRHVVIRRATATRPGPVAEDDVRSRLAAAAAASVCMQAAPTHRGERRSGSLAGCSRHVTTMVKLKVVWRQHLGHVLRRLQRGDRRSCR